jgi:hypothetical protein
VVIKYGNETWTRGTRSDGIENSDSTCWVQQTKEESRKGSGERMKEINMKSLKPSNFIFSLFNNALSNL